MQSTSTSHTDYFVTWKNVFRKRTNQLSIRLVHKWTTHLRGSNWVHVPNTQLDIYEKTRDLLNTGVGLVNKEVIVCVNM